MPSSHQPQVPAFLFPTSQSLSPAPSNSQTLPFPSWSENIPTVASLLLSHVSKPHVEVYFYRITSYFFQQDTAHETFPDMPDHTRGCGSHLPLHLKYSKTYKCLNPPSDQGTPALLKALQWSPHWQFSPNNLCAGPQALPAASLRPPQCPAPLPLTGPTGWPLATNLFPQNFACLIPSHLAELGSNVNYPLHSVGTKGWALGKAHVSFVTPESLK